MYTLCMSLDYPEALSVVYFEADLALVHDVGAIILAIDELFTEHTRGCGWQ